jgi:hypothetical protein
VSSDRDVRNALLSEHGPCICVPQMCTGDLHVGDLADPAQFCRPCAYLDPYWDCFNDPGAEVLGDRKGTDTAKAGAA